MFRAFHVFAAATGVALELELQAANAVSVQQLCPCSHYPCARKCHTLALFSLKILPKFSQLCRITKAFLSLRNAKKPYPLKLRDIGLATKRQRSIKTMQTWSVSLKCRWTTEWTDCETNKIYLLDIHFCAVKKPSSWATMARRSMCDVIFEVHDWEKILFATYVCT
jgi:hypothetical protein